MVVNDNLFQMSLPGKVKDDNPVSVFKFVYVCE